MKFNKKKFFIFIIVFILIIFLLITTVLKIVDSNKGSKNEPMILNFKSGIDKIENFESDYYKIGWLQVQGTNIDLPILDFSSSYTNLEYSYGWRTANYNSDENREVLLGHNILNVSSEPIISSDNLKDFEELMAFSYAGFAKENLYIQYTKDGVDELYAIYAIGFYDYDYDVSDSISGVSNIRNYIEAAKKNSIYDYDIDVNENDVLLTLKTCTRYFGMYEKQEFVIDARRVRTNEEIIKYNVVTNELFEELISKDIDE